VEAGMALSNSLLRSTPEAQGISSASIQAFVRTVEQDIQSLHSFMLLRHGMVVAEGWWYPYRLRAPHMLFSLSKSFTSTAVGLAVAEGRLSIDDPLLKFFPDEAPKKISKNLAAMQVRHLLSMSTGHAQDSTERSMAGRNPFKAFLALPVEYVPGTHFVYNSGATFMLAAIVQKLTGQTLVEYLTPRLFEPLGIEGAVWESHPNGVNFGGWGLNIKTEDIARFGQLYLQKGVWRGQQLVPAAWVQAATSKQVSNAPNPAPDWEQGYGYQFWRCQPAGIYRGDGAFGQYCIVMPEQDVVLAITAGLPDMQVVLTAVWEKLLPGIEMNPLPEDCAASDDLAASLNNLKLVPPHGQTAPREVEHLSGKTFVFEPNAESLHSLSFNFKDNILTYRLLAGGERRGKHTLSFGDGKWVEGLSALGAPGFRKTVASGSWLADDTFRLSLCQYETPFTMTIICRFEGDQVYFDSKVNVGFGPTERPQLLGKSL
jgi:CubicO group peptidase (beta-lactamase class C family)